MQLLDGKKTSEDIKNEIAAEVQSIKDAGGKVPHLAAVIVGTNGASLTYVGSKVKSCQQIGFDSTLVALPENITEEDLLAKIKELNEDDDLDGYIVQLPLPKHIDEEKILMAIDPDKDVDGFHPTNFGKMALEMETFITCNSIWNHAIVRTLQSRNCRKTYCSYWKKPYCRTTNEYFDEP